MAKAQVIPPAAFRASLVADVTLILLLLPMLLFLLPLATNLAAEGVVTILVGGTLIYLSYNIFLPIRRSKPLSREGLEATSLPQSVQLRQSKTINTCALDLVFWRAIVINQSDLESGYGDWRYALAHEAAHIHYRDATILHICSILIISSVAALLAFLPIMINVTLAVFTDGLMNVVRDPQAAGIFVIVPIFVSLNLVLIAWFRKSLHDREFNADRFAFECFGAAYLDYLERNIRNERRARSARFAWDIEEIGSRAIGRIARLLHPPLTKRYAYLQNQGTIYPYATSITCVLLYAFVIVSIFTVSWLIESFDPENNPVSATIAAALGDYAGLLAMFVFWAPLVASAILLSLVAKEIVNHTHGWPDFARYAKINLIITTSIYVIWILGTYLYFGKLEMQGNLTFVFLWMMLSLPPLIAFASHFGLKQLSDRRFDNLLTHVVVGVFAFLSTPFTIKSVHWLLGFRGPD